MGEYARIERKIWNSRTFKTLSEDGQKLWLYLLSCPHGNILGCFVLGAGYVQDDLGWIPKRFAKALQELLDKPLSNGLSNGLVEYDEEAHLVLIKNWLEHNPLENPNQVKAAIKKLDSLPISPIFQTFKLLLEQSDKRFIEPLYKRLGERLGKPVTVTVTETVTEKEPPKGDVFVLPDWIDKKDWEMFLSHRKAIKAPIGKESYELIITKLENLKKLGWDPDVVIGTLVTKGWRWFNPKWMKDEDIPDGVKNLNRGHANTFVKLMAETYGDGSPD